MICPSFSIRLIRSGLVKKEVFERAVKDVLRYKIRAGLMDKNPYLYSTEDVKLDTKEERQTAYDIASQSIVLLENNGVLPLVKEADVHSTNQVKNILLTGPNANSIWAMCGDYSFPSMFYFWQSWKKKWDDSHLPHIVKLLEALQAGKPEGINIKYSRGCDKIMSQVWGVLYEGESRTLDMHIKTLRKKLGDYGKRIRTIRNVGYLIE